MERSINPNKCTGCGACSTACPVGCIQMEPDKEGFLYPKVQNTDCINCGICEKVCHYRQEMKPKTVSLVYGAINKDENIRLQSSSGGVFYGLAKETIDCGGLVFGAAFDETNMVRHISVESVEALPQLMGSKYVQSEIRDTFKEAKCALEKGRQVLFTGTPCQIKGLYAYLGKDFENLITMDFICHGVPSPMIWNMYLEEAEKQKNAKANKISFRSKTYGWKQYSMQIKFSDGETYTAKNIEDTYLRCFISNIGLRKTCYHCTAKGENRVADITVADFWGVEKTDEKRNDDKGVSAVILRGEKAKRFMRKIEAQFILLESDIKCVERFNSSLIKSANINPLRERFFKEIKKHGFKKTFEKYCGRNILAKIRRKAGRFLCGSRRNLI